MTAAGATADGGVPHHIPVLGRQAVGWLNVKERRPLYRRHVRRRRL